MGRTWHLRNCCSSISWECCPSGSEKVICVGSNIVICAAVDVGTALSVRLLFGFGDVLSRPQFRLLCCGVFCVSCVMRVVVRLIMVLCFFTVCASSFCSLRFRHCFLVMLAHPLARSRGYCFSEVCDVSGSVCRSLWLWEGSAFSCLCFFCVLFIVVPFRFSFCLRL